MARPRKHGLDYFPTDSDIFEDLKVRRIKKKHGAGGFAVVFFWLCQIYRNGYYLEYNDDLLFITEESLYINVQECTSILETALNTDFFDRKMFDDYGIITSKGIQKRYLFAQKSFRQKKQPIEDKYKLIDDVQEPSVNVQEPLVNVHSCEFECTKENKRKDKIIKDIRSKDLDPPLTPPCGDEDDEQPEPKPKPKRKKAAKDGLPPSGAARLADGLAGRPFSPVLCSKIGEWLDYKAEQHKFEYQEKGLKSLLSEIENRLKNCTEQQVIDVINLSMANGYKGILWDKLQGTSAPIYQPHGGGKNDANNQKYDYGGPDDPYRNIIPGEL